MVHQLYRRFFPAVAATVLAATALLSAEQKSAKADIISTARPALELLEAASLATPAGSYDSRYVICHVRLANQPEALLFESTACLLEVIRGVPRIIDWLGEAIGPELHVGEIEVGDRSLLVVTFYAGMHARRLLLYEIAPDGLRPFTKQPPGSDDAMPEIRDDMVMVKGHKLHFVAGSLGGFGDNDGVDNFTEYYRIHGLECVLVKTVHEVIFDDVVEESELGKKP